MKIAAVLFSLAALPPQHLATKAHAIPSNCGQIIKLVQFFGIERVIEEARKRGMTDQAIANVRRRCNLR